MHDVQRGEQRDTVLGGGRGVREPPERAELKRDQGDHGHSPIRDSKPAEKLIRALRIVRDKGRISKKEMADLCDEEGIIRGIQKDESLPGAVHKPGHEHNTAAKGPVGFIEEEKIGRNRWLEITEDGKNAAKFLI